MFFYCRKPIAFIVLIFLSISLFGQDLQLTQYTVQEGLPQMQIQGINVDRKGNIWISTRGGISRFNGSEFTNFGNIDCLPSYAHHTAEDLDGNIWIIGPSALIQFDGTDCKHFTFPDWVSLAIKPRITVLPDGSILGSSRFKGQHFIFRNGEFIRLNECFGLANDAKIMDIAIDTTRNFQILGFSDRIEIFKDFKSVKKIKTAHTISRSFSFNSLDHQIDSNHLLSQVTGKNYDTVEYFKLTDQLELKKNCTHTQGDYDLENHAIHHSYFNNSGDLMVLYNEGDAAPFILKNLQSKFNYISGIKAIGEYDFILSDKGLFQLSPEKFLSYSDEELPFVWSVTETANKEIIIGSYGQGLRRLKNGEFEFIETIPKACDHKEHKKHISGTKQIYFHPDSDNEGNIYFATGAGVTRLTDKKAYTIYNHCQHKSDDGSNASLFTLWDDATNNLISCHCDGVYWMDKNGLIQNKLLKKDLQNNSCILTAIKKDDAYYFGYRPHIAKYENGELQILTKGDDSESFVTSFIDHKNNLWFGGSSGLHRIQNDKVEKLDFLSGKKVNAILQYSPNKLFLSLTDGLLMVNLEKFYQTGSWEYRLFNKADGYTDIEPDQNGLFLDSENQLWINSLSGLSNVNVKNLDYLSPEFKVTIDAINNQAVSFNEEYFELEQDINTADIKVSLVGLDRPKDVLFSFSFNDGEYSPAKPYAYFHLENLQSGKHEIKLKAFDNDLKELTNHSFHLKVDVPIYKEPWWPLLLTMLIFALCLLVIIIAFNSRSVQKEKQYLETQNSLIQESENRLSDLNLQLSNENEILQKRIQRSKENADQSKILTLGPKGEILININSILYAQSERNRLRIEMEDKPVFIYITLKEFKAMLPNNQFAQVNRSNLVNIHMIKFKEVHQISMLNNDVLSLSKSGRIELNEVLASI